MKKVSVIIPAYNAEAHIEQCARSVLCQTLRDIEVIFIDDGSEDGTGALLDKLVAGYDNARVVHQENVGLFESRAIGLSLATGEYVGWVDSDDYIEPEMYEELYKAADDQKSELVICDYSWFPKKTFTKEKWYREYEGTVDAAFVERNSQVWNKIVKRDLLNRLDVGPLFISCFDEIYIRVLLEAKNPVTISRPLYHYRVSQGTMSSSYDNIAHYRGFVESSKELKKVMQPVLKDSYWKEYFDYRITYYLIITMIVAANIGDKAAYDKNRRELIAIKPAYFKNQHYWRILNRNYGSVKAIAIGYIIPLGYAIANPFSRAVFGMCGQR